MKGKPYAYSLLIGILVGILTVLGQKYLPDSINNFANSGAVWLVPAFLASFLTRGSRSTSIWISILVLLGCVFGYYGFEAVLNGHTVAVNSWMIVWFVMAFVGGTIFGYGAYLANRGAGLWRLIGRNLLPAVFIAESTSKFLHFSDYSHLLVSMILSLVIGGVLYLFINWPEAAKMKNMAVLFAFTALGTGLFELLCLLSG